MSNRASFTQLSAMVEFMEKHPALAQGTLKSLEGRSTSKRLYNKLTLMLNSLNGVKKTQKGWAKYWADKKFSIKRAVLDNPDTSKLSHIDRKMYEVCFSGKEDALSNSRHDIKKENIDIDVQNHHDDSNHDDNNHNDDDDEQEEEKSITEDQTDELPINFVEQPMMDVEERQTLLMEKLVKVMADQSNALSQLAHATQLQAAAMDKFADASQIQARALDRIATSFESISSSIVDVRHSIGSIDNNLRRIYTPTT